MTFTDKNKLKHKHFQTYLMSPIGPKMKPSKVQKRHYDVINLEISKTEKKHYYQIFVKSFVESISKIGMSSRAVKITYTHTQPDRQTDRRTNIFFKFQG